MDTKDSWNVSLGYCEKIASIPISEITSADVLKIITPLWHDKGATADKVTQPPVLSHEMEHNGRPPHDQSGNERYHRDPR